MLNKLYKKTTNSTMQGNALSITTEFCNNLQKRCNITYNQQQHF